MSDETEATQPGVEKVELVSAHEDRLSAIESIANGINPEEEEIVEETPEEEVVAEEVAEEPEEEAPKTRKLKVEGEEVERTEEEIIEAGIRALQKESSADKRLEEATQLLKEAKEQQNLQPSTDVVTQEDQPPLVDAETMQKIQYGTEEEARLALDGVIRAAQVQPTPQPQPNVEEAVQTALERRDVTARLETEFPEVFKDQRLQNMARIEIDEKLKAGEPSSYETYQKVLTGLMDWRGTKEDDGMAERKEKKAAAAVTNIKTASTTKSVEPEEKPQTTQDVINEIAKARGQMT